MTPATPASLLTIFGATGDLAQRMLLPSLYSLQAEGLLPENLRILGTARSELDREGFARVVEAAIAERIPATERNDAALRGLVERLDYCPPSVDDDASMATLAQRINALRDGDVLYHLSTAPRFYVAACHALAAHGAAGAGTRVMLEKPIGKNLASAEAINDGVAEVFDEDRVYRVDHYLGKEGVQNLIALRFGNALFEPLWSARHIEQVQITVAETVGVEGRGDYYDDSGALRDMLQNHLLQLLCLVAMEPPAKFEPTAMRNEKIKVLRSLREIGRDEVGRRIRGRPIRRRRDQWRRRTRLCRPNSAATAAPKPSSPCARTSTTGAGRACRSTCAPASACQGAAPRSTCNSARCRIRSSAAPPPPTCAPMAC